MNSLYCYNNDSHQFINSYVQRDMTYVTQNAFITYLNNCDKLHQKYSSSLKTNSLKLRVYDFIHHQNYFYMCTRKRIFNTLINQYVYKLSVLRMSSTIEH